MPRQHCDARVTTLQADARMVRPMQLLAGAGARCPEAPLEALGQGPGFHAVLSDMCQATSLPAVDAVRSHELAACAAGLAVGPDAGFAPEAGPPAVAAAGTQSRVAPPGASAEVLSSESGKFLALAYRANDCRWRRRRCFRPTCAFAAIAD